MRKVEFFKYLQDYGNPNKYACHINAKWATDIYLFELDVAEREELLKII